MIDSFFTHPSYYTIDSAPVLMIYELDQLINGLGGIDATASALNWWRERARDAGLPDIHLQLSAHRGGLPDCSGIDGKAGATDAQILDHLGFQSQTHYQMVHFTDVDRPYPDIIPDKVRVWNDMDTGMPYFPHVSLGWDNNPRHARLQRPITTDTEPQHIETALREARSYLDSHPDQPPLVTINSWNEWTEGSYLQPDSHNGYACLEAVKRVFGSA